MVTLVLLFIFQCSNSTYEEVCLREAQELPQMDVCLIKDCALYFEEGVGLKVYERTNK